MVILVVGTSKIRGETQGTYLHKIPLDFDLFGCHWIHYYYIPEPHHITESCPACKYHDHGGHHGGQIQPVTSAAQRHPAHPPPTSSRQTQSRPKRPPCQLLAAEGSSTVYLDRSSEDDDESNGVPPIDLRTMCPPPCQPTDLCPVHSQVLRKHVNVFR